MNDVTPHAYINSCKHLTLSTVLVNHFNGPICHLQYTGIVSQKIMMQVYKEM